ncbi:MAG: hypothetical protein H7288_15815 [Kineosporiaceae bacterium]|nr:hypothetical protein [Aeromicrobium sp.]
MTLGGGILLPVDGEVGPPILNVPVVALQTWSSRTFCTGASLGIPVMEQPERVQVQLWKGRPELRPMAAANVQSLYDIAVPIMVYEPKMNVGKRRVRLR